MPDHIHVFIGMQPHQSISNLVQTAKANSSKWINENKLVLGKFNWQPGFGAFSYSHSQIDNVVKYILNQQHHHRKKTFREEYIEFLDKFHVPYDERYLFKFIF